MASARMPGGADGAGGKANGAERPDTEDAVGAEGAPEGELTPDEIEDLVEAEFDEVVEAGIGAEIAEAEAEEARTRARMAALDARLSALEEARAPRRTVASDLNQAQIAWRMVTELMTGVGIGFAMGYGLDALLGTKPWLMMVFALLGMAAGIRVMLATAREVNAAAERARRAGERGDGNGDRRGADAPRTGR